MALNPDEVDPFLPSGYYYTNVFLYSNYVGDCKDYDNFSYNCVQASMDILLKGDFDSDSIKYRGKIDENKTNCRPNTVYEELKAL